MESEVIMVYKGENQLLNHFSILVQVSHTHFAEEQRGLSHISKSKSTVLKALSTDQVDPQNEEPGYGNMGEQRTGECKGPGRKEQTNMGVRTSPSRALLTTHEMGWGASKPRASGT